MIMAGMCPAAIMYCIKLLKWYVKNNAVCRSCNIPLELGLFQAKISRIQSFTILLVMTEVSHQHILLLPMIYSPSSTSPIHTAAATPSDIHFGKSEGTSTNHYTVLTTDHFLQLSQLTSSNYRISQDFLLLTHPELSRIKMQCFII